MDKNVNPVKVNFKFQPHQYVVIRDLQSKGRVERCIHDGGLQNVYGIAYIMNGEPRRNEFFEDELDG